MNYCQCWTDDPDELFQYLRKDFHCILLMYILLLQIFLISMYYDKIFRSFLFKDSINLWYLWLGHLYYVIFSIAQDGKTYFERNMLRQRQQKWTRLRRHISGDKAKDKISKKLRRAAPRFTQNTFSFEVKPVLVIFWQAALTLKIL